MNVPHVIQYGTLPLTARAGDFDNQVTADPAMTSNKRTVGASGSRHEE